MKNNILKITISGVLVAVALLANGFADTKMYIGNENDQFIVGIESAVCDVDAAVGMEIRTYFAKKGIVINDIEYGAMPGKTVYTTMVGGKTSDGAFARYKHNWEYSLLGTDGLAANAIEVGYGQGPNILVH